MSVEDRVSKHHSNSVRDWVIGAAPAAVWHPAGSVSRIRLSLSGHAMDAVCVSARGAARLRDAAPGDGGPSGTACERRGKGLPSLYCPLEGVLGREWNTLKGIQTCDATKR